MRIGIVGYQGSGKSTLFEWLTGIKPDPALAHVSQSAMAPVPEPRVEQLCKIYNPKKITLASLEFVDTPGLSRTHEGNATKLAFTNEPAANRFIRRDYRKGWNAAVRFTVGGEVRRRAIRRLAANSSARRSVRSIP